MSDYVGKSPIGYEKGIKTFEGCMKLYLDNRKYKDYKTAFTKIASAFETDAFQDARAGKPAMPHTFGRGILTLLAIEEVFGTIKNDEHPPKDITPNMFKADFKDYLEQSGFTKVKLDLLVKNPDGGDVPLTLTDKWVLVDGSLASYSIISAAWANPL